MKVRKSIFFLAFALLLGMMSSNYNISANTKSFNVHYTPGAPSSNNKISESKTLTATGNECVYIHSETFYSTVTGPYCIAQGQGTYGTQPYTINSPDTNSFVYFINSIPKSGVLFSMSVTINAYNSTTSVSSTGSFTS